jgi:hypothetical protein
MKFRCGDCDEYHDTGDLTIDIGDEGHKVIDDIVKAVMGIVEKRAVHYELLIYVLAAHLEETKQAGLKLGNKSHRTEMIIQRINEFISNPDVIAISISATDCSTLL